MHSTGRYANNAHPPDGQRRRRHAAKQVLVSHVTRNRRHIGWYRMTLNKYDQAAGRPAGRRAGRQMDAGQQRRIAFLNVALVLLMLLRSCCCCCCCYFCHSQSRRAYAYAVTSAVPVSDVMKRTAHTALQWYARASCTRGVLYMRATTDVDA